MSVLMSSKFSFLILSMACGFYLISLSFLTPLQISRRIELAGDIRVTSFGPRRVECAFCGAHVKLRGVDDYTLKSWKLHISHW